MATDVERLIVSLEAQTAKYERALARANGETDKRVQAMQSRFDGFGSGIAKTQTRIAGSLATVGRAFGALGIALTTTSVIAMTSAWTDLNSRVSNAAGGVERGAAVLDQLSAMARRTYSSLNQTAEGYLQNSQALTALGYSTQQQLDLVEALNNSLVISATRGQRAQSVMDAWSQAMADGKLSGDNLNTIIQSGGRLSKALADSMGVSVNQLRKLGEQGKITTTAMYGVTSQLQTLRDEAERMPATVSDGFTLLQNAVFRFVGQADAAVGSSNDLAEALVNVADALDRAPDEGWFDRFFKSFGDEMARGLERDAKDIQGLITLIEYLGNLSPDKAMLDLNGAMGGTVRAGSDLEIALTDAEQAMANLATGTVGRFGEVDDVVQDLFQQILEGRGSVEKAHAAIEDLASVNPAFDKLKAGILSVVDTLFAMRDAANAANEAASQTTTDLGSFPTRRAFNKDFGPDLSNDGSPIKPPPSSTKGKSPTEKFKDDLTQYARKIEMLKQETALTAALNPLLNDYGYAKERLKAVQELENAATKAGLALDPDRRAAIEKLAEGYAAATVEAAKLAEAQGATVQQMVDLRDASRQALDTIIDGFLEGKDAGEIFGNVLQDIGKQLLSMGLNSLMGNGQGANPFGLIGKAFGFAKGGVASRGKPVKTFAGGGVSKSAAIFGEAGPEAAVPLPDGRRIPVDLRMPKIPAMPNSDAGSMSFPFSPVINMPGADSAAVDRVAAVLAKERSEFEGRVKQIVRTQGRKWK